MAVKNRHTAKNRRYHYMNIEQFEFRKTFERLSVGNLAVFGDFKQKFLFGTINNIHLYLTMQKEILESLL